MDSLREIKQPRLLEDLAFTVMICSDEKKTVAEGGPNSNIIWDFDFGGYDCAGYENYKVEVLSAGHNGFVKPALVYMYLIADGLTDNGSFARKKLSPSQNILAVLPTAALGDAYIQRYGSSGIVFNVKNARTRKRISIRFLRPDFVETVDGVDLNIAGVTKWFLTLKLIPMVEY